MDGRLGHLECRYRVVGALGGEGLSTARLERLDKEGVSAILDAALDQGLKDDPTVYVLRRVDAPLVLMVNGDRTDADLTRRWGESLAGAVMRSIVHGQDNADNLVRFSDQADFVAHFIQDLLAGQAWSRWFYGAFASLRPLPAGQAMETVLLEHREHLAGIFARLYNLGCLDRLLGDMTSPTLTRLWSAISDTGSFDRETLRPLFFQALQLVGHLGLWKTAKPAAESLFSGYMATSTATADWRDARGLASTILNMVRFLAQTGHLDPDAARAADFPGHLQKVLEGFDWLDKNWFQAKVLDLLDPAKRQIGPVPMPTGLPLRPAGRGPTPRQRQLLDDLSRIVQEGGINLDHNQSETTANALKVYTTLIAHFPHWSGDPLAQGLITRLLATWTHVMKSRDPGEVLRRVRHRDFSGALRVFPEASRAQAQDSLGLIQELGEPALNLVEILVIREAPAVHARGVAIETGCGGLFLLLRAALDARLPMLVQNTIYPWRGPPAPLPALLLALGWRWSGLSATAGGDLDPGLALWAGLEPGRDRDLWHDIAPQAHAGFQAGLLRLLAGQGLFGKSQLHLYSYELSRLGRCLVAGDETGQLWPLGRIIRAEEPIAVVLQEFLATWEAASGCRPDLVLADASLGPALEHEEPEETPVVLVPLNRSEPVAELAEPVVYTHRTGREALLAALEAQPGGMVGTPAADLSIGLTAIALLRLWARWLRKFADSSVPFLLQNFVRRSGRLWVDHEIILVELESKPLDLVIEMAGYTAELAGVPWLGGRRVQFRLS